MTRRKITRPKVWAMTIDRFSKIVDSMTIDKMSKIVVAAAAAGALVVSIYNATQINIAKTEIKSVHISINSRMDQLLLERGKASKAEGVKQERARQSTADEKPD